MNRFAKIDYEEFTTLWTVELKHKIDDAQKNVTHHSEVQLCTKLNLTKIYFDRENFKLILGQVGQIENNFRVARKKCKSCNSNENYFPKKIVNDKICQTKPSFLTYMN